jgi:uncharacterized protein
MIGIIVQLVLSWIIIWFFSKQNLEVLGFKPTSKRLVLFILFFCVTTICAASTYFLRIYFGKEEWIVNPKFTTILFFKGIWWNIKSVLFEELIFRGVLFYILLKKMGSTKAIIISSILFGMYHWFSYNAFWNPVAMIQIFLLTGAAGLLYAYAFTQTGSIYTPIAIHLGWNFTNNFIFSSGNIGNGIFVMVKQPQVTVSYFIYWTIVLLPYVSFFFTNYFLLRVKWIKTDKLF